MPIRIYRHVPEPGIIRFDTLDDSTSTRWNCVCPRGLNGAPLYVRVGAGGAIQTSETGNDGEWTTRTSGVLQNLNDVAYVSEWGLYLVVGANGTILTSSDAVTWNSRTPPAEIEEDNLIALAYGDGKVLVVNATSMRGNYAAVTTDGTNYALCNMGGGGSIAYSIVYDGTYFVVGRGAGNAWMCFAAADNLTAWTFATFVGVPGVFTSIVVTPTHRIAALNTSDKVYTCPISLPPVLANWKGNSLGSSNDVTLFYANGVVYAVGENGECLVSYNNGDTWGFGPSSGVSTFLRFGIHDPSNPTRAIVVGDSGVTLAGQYGVRVKGYATAEDRPSNPIAQSPKFAFADQPVTGLTVDLL